MSELHENDGAGLTGSALAGAGMVHPGVAGEVSAVMQGARIGRRTALVLVAAFWVLLIVPGVHQFIVEVGGSGAPAGRTGDVRQEWDLRRWGVLRLFEERPTRESLQRFEEDVGRESALGRAARVWYQTAMTRALRQGSEKVVVGRDGWLFYREEIDMAAGRGVLSAGEAGRHGADSIAAVVDFNEQLRARGIKLIVVPVPAKPVIYPEKLWPGYPAAAGPAWNVDYAEWKQRINAAGVEVVDLTDALWAQRASEPLYLREDTHWSPAGMELAAGAVGRAVNKALGAHERVAYAERSREVVNHGDLYDMLELRGGGEGERVTITEVRRDGKPAAGGDDAQVLLLGDSFANVYADAGLGWGSDAGLGAHVALATGTSVQVLARNGAGATEVRRLLAARTGAMTDKKVIVWEFSARDLFDAGVTWERVVLPEP